MNIPDDFPRQPDATALSGAQPKIAVRLVDGQYTSGYTQAELETRHDVCADLVTQLVAYYHRKKLQQPDRTQNELLMRIEETLGQKGWGLTNAEIAWCMRQVRTGVQVES
ncbi:hypothetical protein ACTJKQ_19895 [Acidovorax sp. 22279]|uniref:hypothetical protein n=1 Tax=Acidovorax sp. 22279 TaxID=3453900 RepID=UPI003F852A20